MPVNMLECALGYSKLGWSIIPIGREKKPLVSWKEYQSRRPTEEEIRNWWKRYPNANIGLVTGAISGVIAVDMDSVQGQEIFRAEFGEIYNTIRQRTGKPGGLHMLFVHPQGGVPLQNNTRILPDIDVRGDGGYIVVAPSIHSNGTAYQWEIDPLECGLDDLMPLPEDVQARLFPKSEGHSKAKTAPKKALDDDQIVLYLDGIDEGGRTTAATKLIGWWLRKFDGNPKVVIPIATQWDLRNKPPLGWKLIEETVNNLAARHTQNLIKATTGIPLDHITILHYPDNTRRYNVYVKDYQGYAQMDIQTLLSPVLFQGKLIELTDKFFPLFKKKDWDPWLTKLLEEAEHTTVSVEETIMGTVIVIIGECIGKRSKQDMKDIKTHLIIIDNEIRLRIPWLLMELHAHGDKMDPKTLGQILRQIGFYHMQNRDGRFWALTVKQFRKKSGEEVETTVD